MLTTSTDIEAVAGLVIDLCGIVLDETKGYLVESRLSAIAESAGCKNYTELVQRARYHNDKALLEQIVDAITTNETLFFRDASPFEALRQKVLPDLVTLKAKTAFPRRLRIWSAACSTGQEPYSIAILLQDMIPNIWDWDITILGTDISDAAVRQASAGRYSSYEVERGLPPAVLEKCFRKEGNYWKVKDEIRGMLSFQKMNLLSPFQGIGPFDIIFCRNVAIYFAPEARRSMFHRMTEFLTPDGYLFVGSSESLIDLGPTFIPHHYSRSVFYRPRIPVPALAMAK